MIGFNVRQFKSRFFTAEGLGEYLEAGEKKALGQIGGYIRRTAKNSLKYGPGHSPPGMPPTVHRFFSRRKTNRTTGAVSSQQVSPLRELLFYAFDEGSRSTVVGPAVFSGRARSSGPVPGIMEKGGTVLIERQQVVKGSGRRASAKQLAAFIRKKEAGTVRGNPPAVRTIAVSRQYGARPFMAPALTKSMPRFSNYFSNIGGTSA